MHTESLAAAFLLPSVVATTIGASSNDTSGLSMPSQTQAVNEIFERKVGQNGGGRRTTTAAAATVTTSTTIKASKTTTTATTSETAKPYATRAASLFYEAVHNDPQHDNCQPQTDFKASGANLTANVYADGWPNSMGDSMLGLIIGSQCDDWPQEYTDDKKADLTKAGMDLKAGKLDAIS
jgi:hypothetical protein